MTSRPWSLRAQLISLCIAVMAPLLLLQAWNLNAARKAESQRSRQYAMHLAEITAADTARFLRQTRSIAAGLATRHAVAALDAARCDAILGGFLELAPRFDNALTLDIDGNLICSGRPLAAGRPPPVDPAHYLGRLRETGQLVIGTPAKGLTGRWVVTVAHPLRDASGRLAGVAGVDVDLQRLSPAPVLAALPTGSVIKVLSGKGIVLAHSADPSRLVGTHQGDGPAARAMLLEKSGAHEEDGPDGVLRTRGFAPIEGTDWIAVASIPAAGAYAPVEARMWTSMLVTLAIVAIALLLAMRWSRVISEPLATLAGTARKVAAGNTASRALLTGASEITDVADQFNRMLDARAAGDARIALQLEELQRWHEATLGREERMLELKREVNALRARPGENRVTATTPDDACAMGANAFILKPLAPERFMRRIDTVLDGLRGHSPPPGDEPVLGEKRDLLVRKLEEKTRELERANRALLSILEDEREARGAQRASEAKLRKLIDGLGPDMFVGLLTPAGLVVEANRPALAAAGLELNDVIGKPVEDSYWFSGSEPARAKLRAAVSRAAAGEPSRFDVQVRVAEGRSAWLDFSLQPMGDEAGRIAFLVPSALVIDERKRAEEALRESEERLGSLARQLLQVQEAERRSVARELHDEVGGALAAIKLNLQSLRRRLDGDDFGAALDDGLGLVEGLIRSVRSLSLDLRPAVLDDLGLIPALKWYCERQAERSGIVIELALDAIDLRETPHVESACFRIVQESLTNALRHGEPSRIRVALRRGDDGFAIETADDGRGFVVDEARRRALAGASSGLLGMEERAKLLGARLMIESAPGSGTRIVAAFPSPREGTG